MVTTNSAVTISSGLIVYAGLAKKIVRDGLLMMLKTWSYCLTMLEECYKILKYVTESIDNNIYLQAHGGIYYLVWDAPSWYLLEIFKRLYNFFEKQCLVASSNKYL